MSDPGSIRSFIRLVVGCAVLANGVAAIVVLGERDLRPVRVAVVLDRGRLLLTDDIETYGAAAGKLHTQIREDERP